MKKYYVIGVLLGHFKLCHDFIFIKTFVSIIVEDTPKRFLVLLMTPVSIYAINYS